MSDLKINNITDRTGNAGPVIAGVSTVSSTGAFVVPVGTTEYRGGRGRAVFAGGYGASSPGARNTLDYIEIATTGNAVDFGDLTLARYNLTACASATRGIFAGGRTENPSGQNLNTIDYVTVSSQGGASDFGDFPAVVQALGGASNQTRGIFAGGRPADNSAVGVNTINFITIASTGDASDFGDLLSKRMGAYGMSSPTRALFVGGYSAPLGTNVIQYVEIATTGNAVEFGNISSGVLYYIASANSQTRGTFTGNTPSYVNTIEYVTMATKGNSQDFGDLSQARGLAGGTSNSIRGVLGGGYNPGREVTIDYWTIASTGNATDFGDTTLGRSSNTACGDAQGGIG